jgi:PRTRC genetic system protein B
MTIEGGTGTEEDQVNCTLSFGSADNLTLKGAILVYTGSRDAFVTWHEAEEREGRAPGLGPAQPLSTAFLRTLAQGLGSRVRPEILPENVLMRTPDVLMWWIPAGRRRMFFRETDEALGALNGQVFPQPGLIFRVSGRELRIRALRESVRPRATTLLHVAPYYNAQEDGLICQGSMRSPEGPFVAAMEGWEEAFFGSEFTHVWGGGRMCRYKGGVGGLWRELAGKRSFPVEQLAEARQTLQAFAERDA